MLAVVNTSLFKDLDPTALSDIMDRLRRRHYQPEEYLCRLGAPGDSLFIIERGLVEVVIDLPNSTTLLDRLRHGDIVGEMALITGEPRAASVVAVLPTTVLELTRDAFAAIVAQHPSVLYNINHILIQRQKRSNAYLLEQRRRGEAIALLMGWRTEAMVADTITALQATDPQGAAVIDLTGVLPVRQITLEEPSVAAALSQLDDLLVDYRTVILVADTQQRDLPLLVKTVDRVDLIADLPEARQLYSQFRGPAKRVELIVLADESPIWPEDAGDLPVRHTISRASLKKDLGWLARHLARKKIGLALGAGGAKAFAHIGALSVLEDAGYTIDYIAGSSMGGLVGGLLAMGMNSAEIDAAVKHIWSLDKVAELGVFSQEGLSVGLQRIMQATRAAAGELTFAGLKTPLTVMTADLNAQQAAPVREGRLGEALCAGLTIPGLAPPYIRGAQRLVDGIAIMPVPTAAVRDAGADLVIAINLLHRETLPAWPTETPPPPAQRKSSRMMDPVIETLIMLQMDESIRHAGEADVVITPRFGPMSWRDYYLADFAREAGRQAAQEQLPRLLNQVKPS